MTIRLGLTFTLLLTMLAASGCGGGDDDGAPAPLTCEEFCAIAQDLECEDAPTDCNAECDAAAALNAASGCEAEYEGFISCLSPVADELECGSDQCQAEGMEYAGCIIEYCDDHPEAEECA